MNAKRRVERLWHILRHVPPRQLLRRVELRLRARRPPLAGLSTAPPPPRREPPPRVASPPAPAALARTPAGWRLSLPWGGTDLARPLSWQPATPDPMAAGVANNLHYMEYLESVDDAELAELVRQWIDDNPGRDRDSRRYAWRPYNLSLRLASWLRELDRRPALEPGLRAAAERSAALQLRFLERHLETDLRGNHLIKNMKALLWGGAHFDGPEAARWAAQGRRLLRRELAEQVLGDGCHYERSPAYHCQVTADLIECRCLLDRLGAAQEQDRLDAVLTRMLRVAALLSHPDGEIALLNDGGLHMAPRAADLQAAFLAAGGAVAAPDPSTFALPDAGYYGLHLGDEHLLLDCGAIGPDYLVAHGHCDLLAFEWSTGGRRIVVDQGTFQYAAGPLRVVSRATASHNTVAIDGVEQSDVYGAFRCGRRARPDLLEWAPAPAELRFVGSHDGYAHLDGGPRHVREVTAAAGEVVVRDRIEGGRGQRASAALLLHPDCVVERAGEGILIHSGPVTVRLDASTTPEIAAAEWYPDLYVRRPTTRLRLPLTAGGEALEVRLRRVDRTSRGNGSSP